MVARKPLVEPRIQVSAAISKKVRDDLFVQLIRDQTTFRDWLENVASEYVASAYDKQKPKAKGGKR